MLNAVELFEKLSPEAQQKVIDYLKAILSIAEPLADATHQDENTKK